MVERLGHLLGPAVSTSQGARDLLMEFGPWLPGISGFEPELPCPNAKGGREGWK